MINEKKKEKSKVKALQDLNERKAREFIIVQEATNKKEAELEEKF